MEDDLRSLFEAARWAASSYNERPWSYIVATKQDAEEFERLLSCLVEASQEWAKAAPVLALACTSLDFSRNNKPNAAAVHDLGLAAGNLSFEATARGLSLHQMIGIRPDTAREVFQIPEGIQPVPALAIGYAADSATLPATFKERGLTPRQLKLLFRTSRFHFPAISAVLAFEPWRGRKSFVFRAIFLLLGEKREAGVDNIG